MVDVRWFAQNDYERLVIPDLERLGLSVATEGDDSARLALVMNHDLAPAAWRYTGRRPTPYISYVWDLPPFRLGSGRSDHVISMNRHLLALPRLGRRYTTRRGYYSRLEFVARRASAVWTPSATTAVDVRERFSINAIPMQYCYNSHLFTGDVAGRQPPAGRGIGPLSLLTVSRLTPPKNQEAVVRVAARLDARVEIIGRGPLQPRLEQLAHTLGVPCRIRSGLTGEEIVTAYRDASVVVCPSRFEGLGLTGIESAICGTPVAASDIPTHREFLGAAAHFFTLDDDDDLVRAIEEARTAGPPPTAHFERLTISAAARRFFDGLSQYL
jgi:glycosyltransferase involved in cell wall biosynthesis